MRARLLLVLLLVTACGEGVTTGRFVGRLQGSDVMVAVQIDEAGRALAYTCGGPDTVETHTRWFAGAIDGETLELEKEGVLLEAAPGHGGLAGSVDGAPFVAEAVASPAGLYEARRDGCRIGAIVDAAAPPVVQGAFCAGDRFAQVDPQGPVSSGGFMVGAGGRSVFVEPVGE